MKPKPVLRASLRAPMQTALLGLLLLGLVFLFPSLSFAVPDSDGDGFPDDIDNCPLVPNPDQLDMDHDGYGDVCDVCPLDFYNDADADGICAPPDNCPWDFNPGQENFNGDAYGDRCDLNDGFILVDVPNSTHLEWQRDWVCDGFNVHRGDLEILRSTGVYTQDPAGPLTLRRCDQFVSPTLDTDPLPVGSSAFYLVACTRGGVNMGLGEDYAGEARPDDNPCPACDRSFNTIFWEWESGIGTPFYGVIDNLVDWCAFWPDQCGTTRIDFSTHVALVAAKGASSACSDAHITCARSDPAPPDLLITVAQQTPQGCTCPLVVITPLHVARLPRPAGAATHTFITAPACP